MEKKTSQAGQAKAPKSRNSDLRKEQNRVASRAYREKRKQKLALLDEILKSDTRDSTSTASDGSDDNRAAFSSPTSRHGSGSPMPSSSVTPAPITTSWSATSQPATAAPLSYSTSSETYDDQWLGENNIFTASGDFAAHPLVSHDMAMAGHSSLPVATTQYFDPGEASSVPPSHITSAGSIALGPGFSDVAPDYHLASSNRNPHSHTGTEEPHFHAQQHQFHQQQQTHHHTTSGLDPDTLRALESFDLLNEKQQRQLMGLIHQRGGGGFHHPTGQRGRSAPVPGYRYDSSAGDFSMNGPSIQYTQRWLHD